MLLELGGTRCFLIPVTDSEAVTRSLRWMKKDPCVLPLILKFYFFFPLLRYRYVRLQFGLICAQDIVQDC